MEVFCSPARKTVPIVLCFLLLLAVGSAYAENLLVNGSFENLGEGWSKAPGILGFGKASQLGIMPDGYQCCQSSGCPSIWQTVPIPASDQIVTLAGYYKLGTFGVPGGCTLVSFTPGFLSYSLVVDGNDVATFRADTANTPDGVTAPWLPVSLMWTGSVQESVGLRIDWQESVTTYINQSGVERVIRSAGSVDAVSLTAVPEPSSFLALIGGLATIGGMTRRRKP